MAKGSAMQEIKLSIANTIYSAISEAFGVEPPSASELCSYLEYPPDTSMGDLAFPCFKLSRALRKGPPVIAETIASRFSSPYVEKAASVSGYLNFYLKRDALASHTLSLIKEKGEKYGSPMCGEGKTVVLDYSSPNTAKPFHIGHLGTTVIGHSLKLLHQFAGYNCIGVNHLGDWGTQFGKMIVAYKKWGTEEDLNGNTDNLVALYVRFHKEAEEDPSLNDSARAEFLKLEQRDEENLALWRKFIEISLKEYKITYGQLGIEFDSYNGESFYTDKMPEIVDMLKEKNLMEIDDGASVVRLDDYGMPVCLILKRDGSTLYPTRDIAAALYRARTYNFEKNIYVTAAAQSLHFAQWFKVCELMGFEWANKLVHVPYGIVSINGEKLATRTGNVVLLRDLFSQAIEKSRAIIEEKNPDLPNKDRIAEEIGVGAVVFHYLSNNRIKDINFVLEDALSFEGNTGPYAQYTYARCCSVLAKAEKAGDADYSDICDEEKNLIVTLSLFPEKIKAAIDDYEPSVITRYILELCTAFNRFYHECSIQNAEGGKKSLRIELVSATKQVLGTALHLICLKTPEKI